MNKDLAQARIARKQLAATYRKEIRATIKKISNLTRDLTKPKADVWSLALTMRVQAGALLEIQKKLNAVLNHGDEVKILAHAAKTMKPREIPAICVHCGHRHNGELYCDELVVVERLGGINFKEPCGCNK